MNNDAFILYTRDHYYEFLEFVIHLVPITLPQRILLNLVGFVSRVLEDELLLVFELLTGYVGDFQDEPLEYVLVDEVFDWINAPYLTQDLYDFLFQRVPFLQLDEDLLVSLVTGFDLEDEVLLIRNELLVHLVESLVEYGELIEILILPRSVDSLPFETVFVLVPTNQFFRVVGVDEEVAP